MIDNTEWLKTREQRLNGYLGDADHIFHPKRYPDMTVDGDTCTMTFEYVHELPDKTAKVIVRFEDVEFPFGTTVDVYTTIDEHTKVCNRDIVSRSTHATMYDLLDRTKEEMRLGYEGRVPHMVLECLRKMRFKEILRYTQCRSVKEVFDEAAKELDRLKIPEIEVWLEGFPEEVRTDVLRYAVDRRFRHEDDGWDDFNEWLED